MMIAELVTFPGSRLVGRARMWAADIIAREPEAARRRRGVAEWKVSYDLQMAGVRQAKADVEARRFGALLDAEIAGLRHRSPTSSPNDEKHLA